MMGLEASTFSSMLEWPRQPPTVVKYLMAYLADAVFPAPDSPLMMRDWFFPNLPERDMSRGQPVTQQDRSPQTHHGPEDHPH